MTLRPLLLVSLLLLSFSAAAQLPTREASVSLGLWDSDRFGNGPAIGASYNLYWTPLLSTRVGGFGSRAGAGDLTTLAAHGSAELHFLRASRVSPWVGAGLALVYTRRAASNDHFTGSETNIAPIVSGGADVTVSPRLAIGGEISYMNYEPGLAGRFGEGVSVDPLMAMISARYRW